MQDIETLYYPGQPEPQTHVMASYREEFRYVAGSQWIADRLRELGLDRARDHARHRPRPVAPAARTSRARTTSCCRSAARNPLKNFPLTVEGVASRVPEAERPRLWLFGIEPELGDELGARYFERPSDAEVNELYNRAPRSSRPAPRGLLPAADRGDGHRRGR